MVVPISPEFEQALVAPLNLIQARFEKGSNIPAQFVQDVQTQFSELFKSDEARSKIPFLTSKLIAESQSSSQPSNKLVRWRCMIQDTNLGNEVLPSQYRTSDGRTMNGLFGASSRAGDGAQQSLDNDAGFSSLATLCGVSLPAQSEWSKCIDEGIEGVGRSENSTASSSTLSDKLPRGEGEAILLKVYDEDVAEKLQVSQIVDVMGIIDQTVLPSADWTSMGSSQANEEQSSSPAVTHTTLHVIALEVGRHQGKAASSSNSQTIDPNARSELLQLLGRSVGGDLLVAEWLLLALAARIHTRSAAHMLGALTLNISNFPLPRNEKGSEANLLTTLRAILPFVADQSLDLTHLNAPSTLFAPKSDADERGLKAGRLQLVRHSVLFIDESSMNEGQLRENGINNIRSLSTVLQTQKLPYTFPFSTHEMDTHLSCIVTSQGKSFLPVDVQVPWQGTSSDVFGDATLSSSAPASLPAIREYLSNVQQLAGSSSQFTISNDISEKIQDDFVTIRKANQAATSANSIDTQTPLITIMDTQEDLARIIQVARLICLTNGEKALRWQDWQEAKRLEQDRLVRLNAVKV